MPFWAVRVCQLQCRRQCSLRNFVKFSSLHAPTRSLRVGVLKQYVDFCGYSQLKRQGRCCASSEVFSAWRGVWGEASLAVGGGWNDICFRVPALLMLLANPLLRQNEAETQLGKQETTYP